MAKNLSGLASVLGVQPSDLTTFLSSAGTSIPLSQFCAPGVVNVASFTAALTAADGKSLEVAPGTYTFPSQITTTASVRLFCKGRATFKLGNGVIVNTDASATNYASILQVRGCSWFVVENIDFDGNRDNQTYPATVNTFGRGVRPFRHNALLEFVPGNDNTTPSRQIQILGCGFRNAYMSGVSLWQAGYAKVENCDFENNTWSGLVGCGLLAGLDFLNNRGLRNGVSSVYDVTRQTGDRATIQIRESDPTFTAASELIPTIVTTNSQFSFHVNITGNNMVEDQVEGIFVRGAFDCKINNNRISNCGYQRVSNAGSYNGQVFNPGAIWFEWGTVSITNNYVVQSTNNAASNWFPPDGIVCFSMEGDGVAPITMDGVYTAIIGNNTIHCGQAYNSGTAYTADTEKRNNIYRGIRSNGNVLIQNNVIEGTSAQPMLFLNDNNYNTDLVKRITISGGVIRNFLGDGAIHFLKFSTATGVGGSINIMGTRIFDGRSPTTGFTRAMVLFDTNLDGQQLDNINICDNNWDCLNSADNLLNYYGVRQRGAAAAKVLNINGNTIRNTLRAVRVSAGDVISITNNTVSDCPRFIEVTLTANVGSLMVANNNIANCTFALFDFAYSTFSIARFTCTNNIFQGTGNRFLNGFDATKTTVFIVQPNLVRMPNDLDVRRTFAGAPTTHAFYVGEIVKDTTGGGCYIAKDTLQATAANDWSLLA
jgi:parallel beta-helix repeat protein